MSSHGRESGPARFQPEAIHRNAPSPGQKLNHHPLRTSCGFRLERSAEALDPSIGDPKMSCAGHTTDKGKLMSVRLTEDEDDPVEGKGMTQYSTRPIRWLYLEPETMDRSRGGK